MPLHPYSSQESLSCRVFCLHCQVESKGGLIGLFSWFRYAPQCIVYFFFFTDPIELSLKTTTLIEGTYTIVMLGKIFFALYLAFEEGPTLA